MDAMVSNLLGDQKATNKSRPERDNIIIIIITIIYEQRKRD